MLKRYYRRPARLCAIFVAFSIVAFPRVAPAETASTIAPLTFHLDVSINGTPTGLVASFTDLGGGRFAATASELGELGLLAPSGKQPDDLVALDDLPGLLYVYNEPTQSIAIETSDRNRVTKSYDARGELDQAAVNPSNYSAVMNYTLFASHGGGDGLRNIRSSDFSGINATLDGRLIAPFGILDTSAIVGATLVEVTETLRLETTYTYSDDAALVSWRAGDIITGGTTWSRPVRLGGIQAQRAFSMRPDLIRSPLPAISGSAAVPSSVDIYINGIKSYTKDVAAGPYQIDNIPSVSGAGVAQVVTRDASGRETVEAVSFYTSPQLLKPGLLDFSVETGFARSLYGIESNVYGDSPFASGTLRGGIADWLTAEVHGEAGTDLVNGGAGIVASVYDWGIVTGAVSASTSNGGAGVQLYAGFETKVGSVSINGRSQHAIADYQDIASITARDDFVQPDVDFAPGLASGLFSYAPPRAIDSITFSSPLAFDGSTISATYLRYQSDDSDTTQILTASYSRPIFETANLYATGYTDINKPENAGFFVGVSMALDGSVSVSSGVNARGSEYGAQISANKPVAHEPGSWGWRITDIEDATPYRSANVGYRSSAGRVEAGVTQDASGMRTQASAEGALAFSGGSVFATNRIDDAFAVVDVHVPNVKVQRENSVVGTTNDDGKILIPNLNAYQRNKISIDPMDLPLNAEPATTYDYVKPGFKSGVYVDFDVKTATPSAIVILTDASGAFLAPGSDGHVEGSGVPFVVGYDGQAFITDLKTVNTVRVARDGGTCTAHFAFAPTSEIQPIVGPEICQ